MHIIHYLISNSSYVKSRQTKKHAIAFYLYIFYKMNIPKEIKLLVEQKSKWRQILKIKANGCLFKMS